MGINYKILGQVAPASAVSATLYQVPSSATGAICSTLAVCNRAVASSFSIIVRPSSESFNVKHYILYNNYVNQYDSVLLTIGITLNTNDIIEVIANMGNLSFSLFGSEIVP